MQCIGVGIAWHIGISCGKNATNRKVDNFFEIEILWDLRLLE